MGKGNNQSEEEAIVPDEIIDEQEFGSDGGNTSGDFRDIQDMKAYFDQKPWLRVVSLLLAIVVFLFSFVVLACVALTAAFAAIRFFKSDEANASLNKTFAFYRHFLAAALSFFIGFFNPTFGAGIAFVYVMLEIDNSATFNSLMSKYAPKE